MAATQIYGFILFGVGLVLGTIGSFIAMVRNPAAFNNQSRANFDPVRRDIPDDAIDSFGKAQWYDAKAKWWTRIGMVLGLGGMLLIYIGAAGQVQTISHRKSMSLNS